MQYLLYKTFQFKNLEKISEFQTRLPKSSTSLLILLFDHFSLWRKCCVAYALQCVENEDSLAAVPYFLAVNDVDNCVNQLCDGKFFREAWIIAKMRKEDSDPIFEKIMKMWTAHFDYSGNFEAGAAL